MLNPARSWKGRPQKEGSLLPRPDVVVSLPRVHQSVYLVMIRVQPANEGDPNTEVYCAKLTLRAAEVVRDRTPGSWIDKVVADKV